ncbi:TrmH family RNA methyltransferase [Bdellovibrio sp. HCB337]|uniref:TrmH family RNA methyltransferase n=1 Tax=Bdellovibrio sp. HCB337 TaxID=3394358 RepID=UPI0039A70957
MFPHADRIPVDTHLSVHYDLILQHIGPLLTPERRQKIDRVVAGRNFETAVVLEGIYDRGNISAVMRTAEGLGFANFHVVETQEKFKEANRVTQGADKWVEVQKWKQSKDCIKALKDQGYRICVTTLEASKPLAEIDFSGKTALVLGNEKDGVSREMIDAADERMIIPMPGFVQSFNISVAGALCLYHIMQDRIHRRGSNADLSQHEQDILKALYYMRTQDSSVDYLKEMFSRGTLA